MLSLCRTMISREEAEIITIALAALLRSGGFSQKTAKGNDDRRNDAAQRNVAGEGEQQSTNMQQRNQQALGASARKAPAAVATPLPPLKRSHTVNMCPRIAQKAATAARRKIVRLSMICGEASYRLAGMSPDDKAARSRQPEGKLDRDIRPSARREPGSQWPAPSNRCAQHWSRQYCRCRSCGRPAPRKMRTSR